MRRLLMIAGLLAAASLSSFSAVAEARGTTTIRNGAHPWQYSNNRAYSKPKLNKGNTFVQLGLIPALGGVRSLPGWSGAR